MPASVQYSAGTAFKYTTSFTGEVIDEMWNLFFSYVDVPVTCLKLVEYLLVTFYEGEYLIC